MIQILIRACQEREEYVSDLREQLPGATVIYDQTRNAMNTFLSALHRAGDAAALHMEDDVLLTDNFLSKAKIIINEHNAIPVQFFSRRKADITTGSRLELGRTFLAGLCFYLPRNMSRDLIEYASQWDRICEHPTGLDLMIADYLRENRLKYWLHVPSLVQHRICESLIDPRRSRYRQSLTFCR